MNGLQSNPLFPLARLITQGLAPICGRGKLARYARLFQRPLEKRYWGVSGQFMDGFKDDIMKEGVSGTLTRETFAGYYDRVANANDLNRMLYVDTKTWLPDDLLVKADKMTMAASVELRVPFLDHRLAEFAARLPVSYKIHGGETKYLLKKLMEPYLPRDVIYRTKKGFPVPIAGWFRNGLHGLAIEMLLSPHAKVRTYLNQDNIGKMLQWHKSGTWDLSNELWGLLILEYWMREFQVQS